MVGNSSLKYYYIKVVIIFIFADFASFVSFGLQPVTHNLICL